MVHRDPIDNLLERGFGFVAFRWRWFVTLMVLAVLVFLTVDIVMWDGGIRISRDGERVGIVQRVSPSKGFIWTAFEFELAQYSGVGSHQGKRGQTDGFGPATLKRVGRTSETRSRNMRAYQLRSRTMSTCSKVSSIPPTIAKRVVPLE